MLAVIFMKNNSKNLYFITYLAITLFFPLSAFASNKSILVQSTTSTKNSGFYDYILPLFRSDTGINVNVVAVGTGAAIKNARNCDGDVLFVHSPKDEEKFVADGFANKRYNVMYNDFILVGSSNDPAGIVGIQDIGLAFKKIIVTGAKFVSRSDNSGTHSKELTIWEEIAFNPEIDSGKWYFETGSGMGATLNIAIGLNAYTIVDRASWHSFSNKLDYKIVLEGDSQLFNPYGVMLIDKKKCPSVKSEQGQLFIDWLISDKGQSAIQQFEIDGQRVFTPNPEKSNN